MEIANIALRLLAASQILLLIFTLAFSQNPLRVRVIGVLSQVGVLTYMLMPIVQDHLDAPALQYFWFLATISPSMMLIFVWFLFEEGCTFPHWLLALVTFSIGASLYYQLGLIGLPGSPLWLRLLKIFIAAVAIYVVWRGKDNDLVEMRNKMRNIFIFFLALITFLASIAETITNFDLPIILATVFAAITFLLGISINYTFLRKNPLGVLIGQPMPVVRKTTDPVLVDLLSRMDSERLYADHDLRVASLANMLNVPEYKLRAKINQELGYRNFNQFVNHYRIEEAGVRLREDTRLPVLSIALDVGFRSISSFNTAFQTEFGVSPTKYRAETLADS